MPSELKLLQQRAHVVGAIRAFFMAHDFLEVDTPMLISAPAPELHIEAVPVHLQTAAGQERRFLQTSPELAMKRLLAAGLQRIYQIAPVVRDGDDSPLHRPEFRLLEWYRREAPWTTLLTDCEALLVACAQALGRPPRLTWCGKSIDLTPPFRRMRVEEAFVQYAGFSILEALERPVLTQAMREHGIFFTATDSWDDLFHRAFFHCIEPRLAEAKQPIFLTHYPAPVAALARLSPEDGREAERFELFVGGVELANGFGELCDAREQRLRFVREQAARQAAGKRHYPLDERFLAALTRLPPSAGIALGLERLLMLLFDAPHIDAVAFVPWSQT